MMATGNRVAKSAIRSGCGVAAMRSISSMVTCVTRVFSASMARGVKLCATSCR